MALQPHFLLSSERLFRPREPRGRVGHRASQSTKCQPTPSAPCSTGARPACRHYRKPDVIAKGFALDQAHLRKARRKALQRSQSSLRRRARCTRHSPRTYSKKQELRTTARRPVPPGRWQAEVTPSSKLQQYSLFKKGKALVLYESLKRGLRFT